MFCEIYKYYIWTKKKVPWLFWLLVCSKVLVVFLIPCLPIRITFFFLVLHYNSKINITPIKFVEQFFEAFWVHSSHYCYFSFLQVWGLCYCEKGVYKHRYRQHLMYSLYFIFISFKILNVNYSFFKYNPKSLITIWLCKSESNYIKPKK